MGYIYKVINNINNKIYIGQTRRTIEIRWKEHIRDSFKPSRSYTSILHSAIRKYGEEAFSVENIETCDNKILNEREIYWINYYDSCNNGYNISHGGNGYLKYEDEELLTLWDEGLSAGEIAKQLDLCTDTVTRRLKTCDINEEEIIQRGIKHRSKAMMKPIYQYDLKGNFIRGYESIEEAEKINNIINIKANNGAIHKIAGGYRWSRQCLNKIDISKKFKTHGGRCRPVYQYTVEGKYIQSFDSMVDAARATNTLHAGIRNVCTGKYKTSGGYRWSYEKLAVLPPLEINKQFKQVVRIDPKTNEQVYYISIAAAARDNNTGIPDIIHVCTGIRALDKGYYWRYATSEEINHLELSYWKH